MPELEKVVHVMRRLVPELWGGTEAVVTEVSRVLAARGIESPIHCTAMLSDPGSATVNGVQVHRHRYVLPWLGLSPEAKDALLRKGGSPLSLSLFFALLRERKVSIVHTHVQHRLGGMARTVARLKGVPLVVSLHGGHFTLPQLQVERMTEPFSGKLEWGKVFGVLLGSRRVLRDADGIICVGSAEYDAVRRNHPDQRVYHVPNGVQVERFRSADAALFRDAYGFRPADKIVLCVSRIDSQKNQLGLVRAFHRFSATHPEHRLVLLGPVAVEAYRQEIVAELERLQLGDRVRLIDGLRPDDPLLPSAYKAAQLFVLPSVHEPFGIVVLEAWAAGTPVLASRVGGIPGFAADGETALLVEPDDEDGWVAGMARLADDGALRSALSGRAAEVVEERFSWTAVADRLITIYKELILAHA